MDTFEDIERGDLIVKALGIDQADIDLHLVGEAAMVEGFHHGFVGVRNIRVLANEANADIAIRMTDGVRNALPRAEIGGRCVVDAKMREDLGVEAFGVVGDRNVIDVADIAGFDDARRADVTEAGDLAFFVLGNRAVAAAEQDLRLDADGAQLFHRVLGRLCLHLAGGGDVGQQRQVDEDGALGAEFLAQLANGFEEGQAFDVADRAADFAQDEINPLPRIVQDEGFDLVGDVRNDLDRGAKIVAAAFALDDVRIDPSGGDVVGLAGRYAGEAFVVAEVEVGLGAVIRDEHFAVLARAHRSWVDVKIGVKLA